MKLFKQILNNGFKKNAEGETVFFPWGVFGSGFVLEDESIERRLRDFLMLYYAVCMPLIAGAVVALGILVTFLLSTVLSVVVYFALNRLLAGCPKSDLNYTLKDAYGVEGAFSTRTYVLAIVLFALLLVVGIASFFVKA